MIRLRPYRSIDASYIISWIDDEDMFYKWTAGRMGDYPLTCDKLNEVTSGRIDNDKYFPFVLTDNDIPVGFFTMRTPTGSLNHIRFGYIIVSNKLRGKGYGKKMLELGLKYAFEFLAAEDVSLGVFANNPKAKYCYLASGLKETGEIESFSLSEKRTWECVEMKILKDEYLSLHTK